MAEEGLRKTDNALIHIGCPVPFDTGEFLASLEDLKTAAEENSPEIRCCVSNLVSTYHPAQPEVMVVKDAKYIALTQQNDRP